MQPPPLDTSEPNVSAEFAFEELLSQVHGLSEKCRHEFRALREADQEYADRLSAATNAVAHLQSVAPRLHPLLQEKVQRLAAELAHLGPKDAGSRESRFERLHRRLDELNGSPIWEVPAAARMAAPDESPPEPADQLLRPDLVHGGRLVFYVLGSTRFVVRGNLRYNILGADPKRRYRARSDSPTLLEIFPDPDEQSRAFPPTDGGRNIMVFARPNGGWLGLRYDHVTAIEDYHPAKHSPDNHRPAGPSGHDLIRSVLRRRGRDHYVIEL